MRDMGSVERKRTDEVGEGVLRRALRLDADEHPPRFDAAALAAAAEQRTFLDLVHGVVRAATVVGVGLGIEAAVALVALNTVADLDLTDPMSVVLALFAGVAQRAVVVGQVTAGPSVAVAALATVLFAIVHERTIGRERPYVGAS